MTKAELVSAVSVRTGYDKTTIMNVLESSMDVVKKSVAEEDYVYLRGFGSFIAKTRAKKLARNISQNTTIEVPEHRIPFFKPANEFKALFNEEN